jgi:hypothetical protein
MSKIRYKVSDTGNVVEGRQIYVGDGITECALHRTYRAAERERDMIIRELHRGWLGEAIEIEPELYHDEIEAGNMTVDEVTADVSDTLLEKLEQTLVITEVMR